MQETLYIGQWHLSPLQSRHLRTSHSSPNWHQLPHRIFLNLTDGLKSLPFQRWFSFWEKPEVTGCWEPPCLVSEAVRHQICTVGGWVTWVIWCVAKKFRMRHDAWAGTLSYWSCQSPVAHSCGLLNQLNSFCGGMFKLKLEMWCRSISHFECDSHTVHMLTQQCLPPPLTSTVKLSLFTHAHSSPFSLAARLHQCLQTVLVVSTMLGRFLDRPHK